MVNQTDLLKQLADTLKENDELRFALEDLRAEHEDLITQLNELDIQVKDIGNNKAYNALVEENAELYEVIKAFIPYYSAVYLTATDMSAQLQAAYLCGKMLLARKNNK